jgi:hypothetical protein
VVLRNRSPDLTIDVLGTNEDQPGVGRYTAWIVLPGHFLAQVLINVVLARALLTPQKLRGAVKKSDLVSRLGGDAP